MSEDGATAIGFKPKKSVALSGVIAGNTAICTVGRTGNDLHYRGYDILDIAESCEFEEIAYLLIHEKLPNPAELAAYKRRLKGLRGLSPRLRAELEQIPSTAHPMDVLRTGVSALGCEAPEGPAHRPPARATSPTGWSPRPGRCSATGTTFRDPESASRSRRTTTPQAGTSCTCCTARRRRRAGCGRCTPR